MTRHITDHPSPSQVSKRAYLTLRRLRRQNGKIEGPMTFDRPRQNGNGRVVQYLQIERGRSV